MLYIIVVKCVAISMYTMYCMWMVRMYGYGYSQICTRICVCCDVIIINKLVLFRIPLEIIAVLDVTNEDYKVTGTEPQLLYEHQTSLGTPYHMRISINPSIHPFSLIKWKWTLLRYIYIYIYNPSIRTYFDIRMHVGI